MLKDWFSTQNCIPPEQESLSFSIYQVHSSLSDSLSVLIDSDLFLKSICRQIQ